MNNGLFKLVFSKVLGIYVPVSELAKNHGRKSNGNKMRKAKRFAKKIIVASIASTATTLVWADAAPKDLDVKSMTGAAIANTTMHSMTIRQNLPKAIIEWNKLNLNQGELLRFDQQGNRSWSVLNRIHDIRPSLINGNIKADGNVYLINQNGIIFGNGAQINVGSLYASTLDITDNLFNEGLLSAPSLPVFGTEGSGMVYVEQGAVLNAATGGRVMLLAPEVANKGIINTPEGQTILAAGKKAYLQSSNDPAGIIVEVDAGGTATNLGSIIADRGSVTLVGLAVNQLGTISASTSVRANGSVRLLARDSIIFTNADSTNPTYLVGRGGKVTIGKDSVTEVRPELQDKEEVSAIQVFKKSRIDIEGVVVDIDGKIIAKGGDVNIKTTGFVPTEEVTPLTEDRIYIGSNALIDVSGVDAIAPMSRNQLEVQLFSDQLKNVPLLRGTDIFRKTVFIDARKNTQLTDTQPFIDLKGRTVAEKLTDGGKVSLSSKQTIARAGATIDVSGGSVTYEAGTLIESKLNVNGTLINISDIDPNAAVPVLADSYKVTDKKWGVTRVWDLASSGTVGWGNSGNPTAKSGTISTGSRVQASYKDGANAGEIKGGFAVLEATVLANTQTGQRQRDAGDIPLGGAINVNGIITSASRDLLADNFNAETAFIEAGLRKINTDFLKNGFNRITIAGQVDTPLVVDPNGSLTISGKINANISAPGSSLDIGGVTVADNVKISTAGLFVNDKPGVTNAAQVPIAINGGNITATGVIPIVLGKNAVLDASAGAWLDRAGELHTGQAGNMTLRLDDKSLGQGSKLLAYGFGEPVTPGNTQKFGELSILTDNLVQIAGQAKPDYFNLSADFFSQGGFSAYSVRSFALGESVTIGDGSQVNITPRMLSWNLQPNNVTASSGSAMDKVATPFLLPNAKRQAASLTLIAADEDQTTSQLVLKENTSVNMDVGGNFSLQSPNQIHVLGDIAAPAGSISIQVTGDTLDKTPYDGTQGIFVGENASLSTNGVYRLLPSASSNIIRAELLNAGNIDITATKGAVIVKNGSTLDVSAANGLRDTTFVTGIKREMLHGDAGRITLAARDGLLIDGDMQAGATGTGRKGSLALGMTGSPDISGQIPPYPDVGRVFTITQEKTELATTQTAGAALAVNLVGKGQISAKQIEQAGFDNVTIKSKLSRSPRISDEGIALPAQIGEDRIALESGLNFKVPRNLTLETPLITVKDNGNASIKADYLQLNNREAALAATSLIKGNGNLTVNTDWLNIVGKVAIGDVDKTTINSSLDINGFGGLLATNALVLTARQIYPNTATTLSLEATGVNSTITINQSANASKPVLSAAGVLNVTADNIEQNGSLRAAFGEINLNAKEKLTLGANSLTSVSADNQLIPLNTTTLGGQRFNNATGTKLDNLPEKAINLTSKSIDLKAGAKLDLSSGGDMFAYEWVPGIGGSNDILARANTFAVLPSLGNSYAPNDAIYEASSAAIKPGDTVYLSGGNGLVAGNYTLLPARYALMPGAFLVEAGVKGSTLLPTQTAKQVDGSILSTGYRNQLGVNSRDADWSTFRVVSGDVLRPVKGAVSKSPSEYIITSASRYFGDVENTNGVLQRLPQDVGKLILNASENLNIDTQVTANKNKDGRGAIVDINSTDIRVVSSIGPADGTLQLTASGLNKLNAESLLLGGTRVSVGENSTIITGANSVTIANDANNALTVSELIATAQNHVTVKTGAVINSNAPSTSSQKVNIEASGEGALLAVSSINDIKFNRTGADASATSGELNIEAGSAIFAAKSLVLDATNDAKLSGNVQVASGGSATFGANRILLGNAPSTLPGLAINNSVLTGLGNLSRFGLNSYSNVDVYGAVNFGNKDLDLSINAAGIAGRENENNTVTITAKNFVLANNAGAIFENVATANNSQLNIIASNVLLQGKEASNINLDAGKTKLDGFTKINIEANELRLSRQAEATFNVAETTITANRITADTGTQATITSNGILNSKALPLSSDPVVLNASGLGAKVKIEASILNIANQLDFAAGDVTLKANNDLNLLSGANVSAKSASATFYNQSKSSPAGTVILQSSSGNVNIDTGAVVNVTGANGASAGTVKIAATNASGTGSANIQGEIKGDASADAKGNLGKGGRFMVDADKLANTAVADVSATNKQAAGFTELRQYRLRQGDAVITGSGNDAITAKNVILSTDSGDLNVTGTIDSSGAKDGSIKIYAKNDVTLASTANLKANSTQAGSEGGTVKISTLQGSLDLKAGSNINVSGGADAKGGKVMLRAPRSIDNNDINITQVATNITGADKVQAEGFRLYNRTSITLADQSKTAPTGFYKEAEGFMVSALTDASKGLSRLGKLEDLVFRIVPGVEVRNTTGNLTVATDTVATDWSLHDWRFDATSGVGVIDGAQLQTGLNMDNQSLLAGVLTLRAAGNLGFNGSLSDGFSNANFTTGVAQGIEAWHYNLVAGADFNSANLNLTQSGTGNLTFANATFPLDAKSVRTGTGDINIATGGNLVMGSGNTTRRPTVIYTAGRNAEALTGFEAPTSSKRPLYLTDGGDINIQVQGNIEGREPATGRQLINNWLFRQGGGSTNKDTTWWVRPDLFRQSLATFGGGDVNIEAGGSISNFSASLPTSARFDNFDTPGTPAILATGNIINGGGDLNIRTGGDINNGVYFVAKGDGAINSGGSIQKQATFGTVLALQDANFEVTAAKNIYIETVLNPTLWTQATSNSSSFDIAGNSAFFNTYGTDAKVNVISVAGNAQFGLNTENEITAARVPGLSSLSNTKEALNYFPARLNVLAFGGDIEMGKINLLPSITGDLNLLAANDIRLGDMRMSDADIKLIPTPLSPIRDPNNASTKLIDIINSSAVVPVHLGNSSPVNIIAQTGSIKNSLTVPAEPTITLPKSANIVAGKDIKDLNATIQHVNSNDITLIKAGNDVIYGTSQAAGITVAGSGELLIVGGRNIDLGQSKGVSTIGNANNPALQRDSANITLQAGLGEKGANTEAYIATYISPNGAGPASIQANASALAAYRAGTAKALTAYMRRLLGDNNVLNDADAFSQFNASSAEAKTIFTQHHLSSELLASGETFKDTNNNARGDNAIALLFPAPLPSEQSYNGDILLFNSKIRTTTNGSIDLVAPGGLINAGVPGGGTKTDIGIITEQGGAIRAFSDEGFEVNQSKVITQFGSDITVWVNNGDIDAGRGSKTATSVPERIVSTDVDGNTTVEVRGVAAGSGIRAQSYDPDGPNGPLQAPDKGGVALIAPRGILNAGEAGIEAGDFLVQALQVIGTDNISVAGASQGVPLAAAVGVVGAANVLSPDATNSAVQDVARSVAQSTTQAFTKPSLPSIISVEIMGIGN